MASMEQVEGALFFNLGGKKHLMIENQELSPALQGTGTDLIRQ